MTARTKKTGFSLTELLVTISIVGVLAGIGLPAANQLQKSFESSERVQGVMGAALSNARAMALAKGKYIGIRFQRNPDGDQYMIFIEADSSRWANGFSSLQGRSPIRLPRSGMVMDMHIRSDYTDAEDPTSVRIDMSNPNADLLLEPDPVRGEIKINDVTSFSIIFSKAGKLVLQNVRISEGQGGDIFNDNGDAMFYIDDYANVGLGEETSRNNFVIINKNDFNGAPPTERWTSYLQHLIPFYINPYTGELIN